MKTVSTPPGQVTGNVEVAQRVFLRIAAEWRLDEAKVHTLLGDQASGVEQRLSYLLRIYVALQRLLPDPVQSAQWLSQPNTAAPFCGMSALDWMLQGKLDDLTAVANYLDAVMSGDYS